MSRVSRDYVQHARAGQVPQARLVTLAQRLSRAAAPLPPYLSRRMPGEIARVEHVTPVPPPKPFYGDAVVLADGVNVYARVGQQWQRVGTLNRFDVALIERAEGPYVYLRFNPRGEGYALFLDPATNRANFQKIDPPPGGPR